MVITEEWYQFQFSIDEVGINSSEYNDYLVERIRNVLIQSKIMKSEFSKSDWEIYSNRLKTLLPDYAIDFEDLTFISSMNQLKSLNKILKEKDVKKIDEFKEVQKCVAWLINKKNFYERNIDGEIIQNVVDAIKFSLLNRIDNEDKHDNKIEKLIGTYIINPKDPSLSPMRLRISNDPIDIFSKSTGQDWELGSCERYCGEFDAGIYSDIEWNNGVVFLENINGRRPLARMMIRWCEQYNKIISWGIEKYWYHKPLNTDFYVGDKKDIRTYKHSVKMVNGFRFIDLTESLQNIISNKFNFNYDYCLTPYVYDGFSDHRNYGGKKIDYGKSYDE